MPKPMPVGGDVTSVFLNDLVGVTERDTTENDIVNSAGEGTVFTKVITGGHMSTNRTIRLTASGDYLNNTGTNKIMTLRVKFGGTTLFGDDLTFAASGTRRIWRLLVEITNLGASNSNFLTGMIAVAADGVGSAGGLGDLEAAQSAAGTVTVGAMRIAPFGAAVSAINTVVDATFAVTAQHNAASASLSFRKYAASLELL